jgi:hypothetical protein
MAAVFMAGLIFGGIGGAWWQRRAFREFMRRGMDPQRSLSRLSKELSLDDSQKNAILPLLEARKTELQKLHDRTHADFEKVRGEYLAEIRKVLKPDQQKKLDELAARSADRRKRWLEQEGAPQR